MAKIVLRVRLTAGDRMDVAVDQPDAETEDKAVDHVIRRLTFFSIRIVAIDVPHNRPGSAAS